MCKKSLSRLRFPKRIQAWFVFLYDDNSKCMWFETRAEARAFIAYIRRHHKESKLSQPEKWCHYCYK